MHEVHLIVKLKVEKLKQLKLKWTVNPPSMQFFK